MPSPNSHTSDLLGSAREKASQFANRFGREPQWLAAAPGRVNVIGEHTDYNEGFVLPMAIERYVVVAAAPRLGDAASSRWYSVNLDATVELSPTGAGSPSTVAWARYIQGVFAGFAQQGHSPPPLDVFIYSTVPVGAGLSSSAALEVAVATLLEAVCDTALEPFEKARLCQQAEQAFAGVPCGIMDQYSSVFGQRDHLMLLDCRTNSHRSIPLVDSEVSVLIFNSHAKHDLAAGAYAERRATCESAAAALGVASLRNLTPAQAIERRGLLTDAQFRCARHVTTENERTCSAARAIAGGDWDQVGELLAASHRSLRADFQVSCRELDMLVELAEQQPGVLAARMTGGGFGGCTINLVRTDALETVAEAVCREYQQATGIEPDAIITRPADGAVVLNQKPTN